MSVACQNLAQNLDMGQKQAVHGVFLGNNVLVCGLPVSRKTHVMFFTHAERLAQSKGETIAVVALGATKVVANTLSSFAEKVHTAHTWPGVGIALVPVAEIVD
jgi:hypothetical protein